MSTMRNSVMLIGRPGAEPETRTFNGNRIVTRFNLAVNETRRNAKNEPVKVTQWFSVVAWDKTAERVDRRRLAQQRMDRQERPTPPVDRDPSQQFHPPGLG